MHSGRTYKLGEFLFWTRRSIGWPLFMSALAVVLYHLSNLRWLGIPFTIIGLLGTAAVFIITFRNQETYNRTWEARKIWGAAMSASRSWAMMCKDFLDNGDKTKELVYRHLAWLTALRYQLRAPRKWENLVNEYNTEYTRNYSIPEKETPVEKELAKYISQVDLHSISTAANKATQLLGLQSEALKKLRHEGLLDEFRFLDMHNAIREFADHQGRSERIKNFPYPRQYATINSIFVRLFSILLPFGLLDEFDKLNISVTGALHGQMVWFVIPFSVLISWVFTSLEQVGESTENPFEGSANDVPITQMSRAVEIDIKEMLRETDIPQPIHPKNDIVL